MNHQPLRILFSNLGYARGIDGRLSRHIFYMHRHFYASQTSQKRALYQLNDLIEQEDPDICCFAEIDQGSFTSGGFNQLQALISQKRSFFDIENKYGQFSRLRTFFITKGKSLAFISKIPFPYEKLYFSCGTKRLIYKVCLGDNLTMFFGHFSLNKLIRARQLLEAGQLMLETGCEAMFLGDFNILTGLGELEPLLDLGPFVLLNNNSPTFKFHRRNLVLDLCIATPGVAEQTCLKVAPQPYSDHAALVLDIC